MKPGRPPKRKKELGRSRPPKRNAPLTGSNGLKRSGPPRGGEGLRRGARPRAKKPAGASRPAKPAKLPPPVRVRPEAGADVPLKVRRLVVARDRGRCVRCGAAVVGEVASLHHRRPRGMGGSRDWLTNTPANLIALCGSGTTGCHGWVESNKAAARELGYLVYQGHDPREYPVLVFGRGRVRLSVDGRYLAA